MGEFGVRMSIRRRAVRDTLCCLLLPLTTLPVGAAGCRTPSVSTISTDVDVYSVQLVYRFR